MVLGAGLLAALLSGCISPRPDPRHLAEIDKLGADRLGSPLQTQSLINTDPRIQVSAPTGVLALDQAIDFALKHNLSLVASATNVPIAQAQVAQAALMQNPSLGQSGAFGIPISPIQGGVAFDVLITQEINTFITQGSRVDLAKAQRFQAGIDLVTQSFQLAQQVDSKYQELVNDARSRRVAKGDADAYERAFKEAQAQARVGMATPSDVNRAKLQFEDAQRQVRHFEMQFERAKQEMNWLMGFSSVPQWQMPDDIAVIPKEMPVLPELASLEELAPRYRLDYLRADYDRKVAAVNIKLAKLNMIPDMTFGLDYAYNGAHQHTIGPQITSMTLPIFDPGIVGLRSAQYASDKAEKTYVALQGQLQQDVKSGYANLKIAEEDVVFYRDKFIPQQAENIRIAEENFRRGFGDFNSYLGALHDYAAAQQAYVAAFQTYHDNGQALETAVGLRLSRILQTASGSQTQPAPATSPAATRPAATTEPTSQPAPRTTAEQHAVPQGDTNARMIDALLKAAEASKKASEAAATASDAAARAAQDLQSRSEKP